LLEWDSDPVNDMIADSIIAVILQTELNPSGISIDFQGDIIY
jgi:hypothetical protein